MSTHKRYVLGVILVLCLIGCDSDESTTQLSTKSRSPQATIQNKLIPYTVIKSSEFASAKASFDVRVDLIDGQLPTKAELVAVSYHLKGIVGPHDRTFVVFYLPGMVVDSGGFATAHHNPNCEFRLLRFNVPEKYASLLPTEDVPETEPINSRQSTEPIDVSFDFSIEWEGSRPVLTGTTNLPDGTQIMTSVSRQHPPFTAQDKVVVKAGKFRAGPFGPPTGLAPGTYEADVTVPYAKVQPANVRAIIGQLGENLQGLSIERHELFGATMSVEKSFTK